MLTKGFTLIETVLTLSIIVITSLFIITPSMKSSIIDKTFVEESIRNVLILAQENSFKYHEKTNVEIKKKKISFHSDHQDKVYYLPDKCYLSHRITVYFNENGNVNKGNHFNIHIGNKIYVCKIHVGSGELQFE